MNQTIRTTFDSQTDREELSVRLPVDNSLNEITIRNIVEKFNRYGVALVEHYQTHTPEGLLLKLGRFFGNPVGHDRSDSNGITVISNLNGFEGYLGASYTEHPLHTGGVYSDEPPIVLLLQCIKPSSQGGDSILVSSKKIHDFLSKEDPHGLGLLKFSGALTMKRGDAKASRAVFDDKYLGNGSYMFSFRCDDVVEYEVSPSTLITTLAKIKNFIDLPENQVRLRLKENQILIADNSAVMHARTKFPQDEDRKLLRLTLDGKPSHSEYPLELGF
ncbi:TauD/TfdA family dioxygenase [Vibrio ostreicida]|uniref:TauD/TfdA family dioxygenase n=1 Tax=Vibrio ostreicida TaxID=526588 RepID=UPI0009709E1A|nr:TauD/TfdA family dioxygenase [Vibrio ostreicida]